MNLIKERIGEWGTVENSRPSVTNTTAGDGQPGICPRISLK